MVGRDGKAVPPVLKELGSYTAGRTVEAENSGLPEE